MGLAYFHIITASLACFVRPTEQFQENHNVQPGTFRNPMVLVDAHILFIIYPMFSTPIFLLGRSAECLPWSTSPIRINSCTFVWSSSIRQLSLFVFPPTCFTVRFFDLCACPCLNNTLCLGLLSLLAFLLLLSLHCLPLPRPLRCGYFPPSSLHFFLSLFIYLFGVCLLVNPAHPISAFVCAVLLQRLFQSFVLCLVPLGPLG